MIGLSLLLSLAWSQMPTPPGSPSGDIKKDPAVIEGTAESTVALKAEVLVYDADSGRDPFLRPQAKDVVIFNPDSLEGVEIPSGVQVIAIAYDSKNPRALMLRVSDKKTYTVYKGTRIGVSGGVVESITEDTVTVRQDVEVDGRKVTERVQMTFKKFEGIN